MATPNMAAAEMKYLKNLISSHFAQVGKGWQQ
jgi:hypothetical protein